MKGKVFIVAGGTGGHINAALSLGESFSKSDFYVSYISGKRFLNFKLFLKEENVWHLNSWPLRYKNPWKQLISVFMNTLAFLKCFFNFLLIRPNAVIGCGGYVCGPSLLAAKLTGVPCFILEQNACAGVTNKILANIADLIFLNFENTKGLENFKRKSVVLGNPIRSFKIEKRKSDIKTILVFGGSLGAQQINDALTIVVNKLDIGKVKFIHQGGKESSPINFINKDIEYEHFEFIDNIYDYYQQADIIISRAGASTVSELQMLNSNCILIPYPQATDNHQYYNAIEMKKNSECVVEILDPKKPYAELAEELLKAIVKLKDHPNSMSLIENDSADKIKEEILSYVFRE